MAIVSGASRVLPAPHQGPLPALSALSRAAVARLRWYFQNGYKTTGALALPDAIDLDLSVMGLIQRLYAPYGGVHYAITPMGERMLGELREHARSQRAPHHLLGSHLAQWLSEQTPPRLTWENCTFDVPVNGCNVPTRPDVFSLATTLVVAKAAPIVHEIKVSRADFLCDVKDPTKRAAYFHLAPRVFYAVPFGLVSKEEVPLECGLVEQDKNGKGWIVKKPAPRKKDWPGLSDRFLLTLVLRAHQATQAS